MNTTARLALSAGALLAFSTIGAVAPAQAVTEHCPSGGTKYEVSAGPSYDTGLPEGSRVCIKAGTKIQDNTFVDADGMIANTTIKNKPGNAYLGISYYVVYDIPEEPECGDYPLPPCDDGGSGS